jgi:hypothetical protein
MAGKVPFIATWYFVVLEEECPAKIENEPVVKDE